MDQKWKFEVGDVVKLKKPHPCGSHEWEILRVGADFRLKCMGCGHQVMTERKMVEKNARGLIKAVERETRKQTKRAGVPGKSRKNLRKPQKNLRNLQKSACFYMVSLLKYLSVTH